MKKLLIFLICLSPTLAFGTDYYVRPSGGSYGSENGTSYANAWDGFSNINWSTVDTGNGKLFVCGTHAEELQIGADGESGAYIWVASCEAQYGAVTGGADDPGIIDGQSQTVPTNEFGLVDIRGDDYVRITGLTLTQGKWMGVRGSNCNYVIVEDVDVDHTGYGGINFIESQGSVSNVTVDNCTVEHSNDACPGSIYHEGITMGGVDTFEVKNSTVFDCEEEGIDAKTGAINGSIHDNLVYNNATYYAGPGIYVDQASNVTIYNNIVHTMHNNNDAKGIMVAVEDYGTDYDTANVDIYNNIIYDVDKGTQIYLQSGTTGVFDDVRIYNNTYFDVTIRVIEVLSAVGGNWTNGVLANNILWYDEATNSSGQGILDGTSGNNWIANTTITNNLFETGGTTETTGSNAVTTADVKFVDNTVNDWASADLRLQSNSPAVDAASATYAPADDYAGTVRPVNLDDIGAYEYFEESTATIQGVSVQ